MCMVYAIKSEKTGRIYIGQTNNIQNRIKRHNIGLVKSTKRDIPWNLYAYEIVTDRKEGMKLEWRIKKSRGSQLKWLENNMMNLGIQNLERVYDS